MATGDIGAVLDTQIIATTYGYGPIMINYPGTNVWLIAYHTSSSTVGVVETRTIDPATGDISNAFIDQITFEAGTCERPELIHRGDDIFAVAYRGPGGITVKTFDCDSGGNIGAVIATKVIDSSVSAYTRGAGFVFVGGNMCAIAYQGGTTNTLVKTFKIWVGGNITDPLDTYDNGINQNKCIHMHELARDFFAIVSTQLVNSARLDTISIDETTGIITFIDSWNFDGASGITYGIRMQTISSPVRAIFYQSLAGHNLVTLNISDAGVITHAFIDSDAGPNPGGYGFEPLGGQDFFVFTYVSGTAFVATWTIAADGTIGAVHDTLSYHAATPNWNVLYHAGSGDVWTSSLTGPPTNDGVVHTFDIEGPPRGRNKSYVIG